MRPTVVIAGREYVLAEPTLLAWDAVFESLDDRHYAALGLAASAVMRAPRESLSADAVGTAESNAMLAEVGVALLPAARSSPRILRALLCGMLRTPDGAPIDPKVVEQSTLSDALGWIKVALDSGVATRLLAQLKNLIAPALATAGAAVEQATQPAGQQPQSPAGKEG